MTQPTSVPARATLALDRLRRLGEGARLAAVADRIRTRADELVGPVSELELLAAIGEALGQRGVSHQLEAASLAGLRSQLIALADRYRLDPEQIAAPDGRLRFTLWDPLRGLPADLQQSLLNAWRDHARGLLPRQRPEILDVLERIPGLQQDARAIREMSAEFERRSSVLPHGDADVARIEELAGDIQTRWQTLEGGGIPADVLDFLAAASLGTARLDQLTPTVRDWLTERSLLSYVRVSLTAE
jgi:hypothetical protein